MKPGEVRVSKHIDGNVHLGVHVLVERTDDSFASWRCLTLEPDPMFGERPGELTVRAESWLIKYTDALG